MKRNRTEQQEKSILVRIFNVNTTMQATMLMPRLSIPDADAPRIRATSLTERCGAATLGSFNRTNRRQNDPYGRTNLCSSPENSHFFGRSREAFPDTHVVVHDTAGEGEILSGDKLSITSTRICSS